MLTYASQTDGDNLLHVVGIEIAGDTACATARLPQPRSQSNDSDRADRRVSLPHGASERGGLMSPPACGKCIRQRIGAGSARQHLRRYHREIPVASRTNAARELAQPARER